MQLKQYTMKFFITTILFILISCGVVPNITAQTIPTPNINAPFVGTWEWENGNQTFRVVLYLDEEGTGIDGDYTMLETNANGQQTIVYKSNKDIGFGYTTGPAIYGGSNGTTLRAGIEDSVTPNPNNYAGLTGSLKMTIVSTANCIGCTTTATWKVKENKEMRFEGDNRTLSIPTDITLIKVQ